MSPKVSHIYIHIPFCRVRCPYCSFFSTSQSSQERQRYVASVKYEIEKVSNKLIIEPATIYLGGGTPSLLAPSQIEKILKHLSANEKCEITIELNPRDASYYYCKELYKLGITRVSLGCQSFVHNQLKTLGRDHNLADNYRAVENLKKAGFKNINIDIIYGLPHQTLEDLNLSLNRLYKLNIQHISTYLLHLDKASKKSFEYDKIPNDKTLADFYKTICDKNSANGFVQYELSNFATAGFESKHNLSYWSDKPYYGFGASASSYILLNGRYYRFTNPSNIRQYYDGLKRNSLNFETYKPLSFQKLSGEFSFLSLRKSSGLQLGEYQKKFGVDFLKFYKKSIQKNREYLIIEKDSIRLKPKFYFVADSIFADFVFANQV